MQSANRLFFEGEELRFKTGKHWVVFFKAALYFFLAMYVFKSHLDLSGLLKFNVPDDFQKIMLTLNKVVEGIVLTLRYCLTAFLVWLGVTNLLSFFSLRLYLTNKRLVRFDLIIGSLLSLDIAKIESVKADPGIFGGVLGYGKVTVTTGSGQTVVLSNLNGPHELEKQLFFAK